MSAGASGVGLGGFDQTAAPGGIWKGFTIGVVAFRLQGVGKRLSGTQKER